MKIKIQDLRFFSMAISIALLILIPLVSFSVQSERKSMFSSSHTNTVFTTHIYDANKFVVKKINQKCNALIFRVAKRGCCSWHKGVCGCENSKVVCCDGTYSPSCGC